ncbi:hypothetical protein M23134_05982 [Microscilla marina ATCC 23134]|uniref:Uncharacterized protein n=1 Tax=Microscilla marina ATCC 23134 TaxID=313606 RepID=A1ZTZ6_MICM2|nr:hypothetical protein M23134_05982 [Microscilla marina ATCC 23134]
MLIRACWDFVFASKPSTFAAFKGSSLVFVLPNGKQNE